MENASGCISDCQPAQLDKPVAVGHKSGRVQHYRRQKTVDGRYAACFSRMQQDCLAVGFMASFPCPRISRNAAAAVCPLGGYACARAGTECVIVVYIPVRSLSVAFERVRMLRRNCGLCIRVRLQEAVQSKGEPCSKDSDEYVDSEFHGSKDSKIYLTGEMQIRIT